MPGQRFRWPGVGFGDGWITQRLERAVLAGKGPIVLRQEVSQLFHSQFLLLFVWISRLKVHGERLIVAGQQVGQLLKECLFHGQFLHFLNVQVFVFPLDALMLTQKRRKRKYIYYCSYHIFLI